ncbi:hypothetical protein KCP74_12455 [Salmonella enterica subsp. enterica]|nr:hypothetical protein KCP74_12455 [Salmonella enterica subsp. enterica]
MQAIISPSHRRKGDWRCADSESEPWVLFSVKLSVGAQRTRQRVRRIAALQIAVTLHRISHFPQHGYHDRPECQRTHQTVSNGLPSCSVYEAARLLNGQVQHLVPTILEPCSFKARKDANNVLPPR